MKILSLFVFYTERRPRVWAENAENKTTPQRRGVNESHSTTNGSVVSRTLHYTTVLHTKLTQQQSDEVTVT